MREIKFRVWDKQEQKIKHAGFDIDPEGNIWCNHWNLSGFYILMQYTGLKDKNGKEIYEGDIIVLGEETYDLYYKQSDKVIVEWDKKVTGFRPFQSWHSDYEPIEDIEVIGNIYEHPELLKEEK